MDYRVQVSAVRKIAIHEDNFRALEQFEMKLLGVDKPSVVYYFFLTHRLLNLMCCAQFLLAIHLL